MPSAPRLPSSGRYSSVIRLCNGSDLQALVLGVVSRSRIRVRKARAFYELHIVNFCAQLQVIQGITDYFGADIWRNAVVGLTHACQNATGMPWGEHLACVFACMFHVRFAPSGVFHGSNTLIKLLSMLCLWSKQRG